MKELKSFIAFTFPNKNYPSKFAVPLLCVSVGTRLGLVGRVRGYGREADLMTLGTIFYISFPFSNTEIIAVSFLVIEFQRSK